MVTEATRTFHTTQPYPWWPESGWAFVPAVPLDRVQELGSEMLSWLAAYWSERTPADLSARLSDLTQYWLALHNKLPVDASSTCMKRCAECIFFKEHRPLLTTKRYCAVLTATGFQQACADHASHPRCVIMAEGERGELFRRLLIVHLEWQINELKNNEVDALRWYILFSELAASAPYKPLHPTVRPTFHVGDEVVIWNGKQYVRGTFNKFDAEARCMWAFVSHRSRSGKSFVLTHLNIFLILHMRDFEFLRADKEFAHEWFEQQHIVGRRINSVRRLRVGLKDA